MITNLLFGLALVGAGGGGAFGLLAAGVIGGADDGQPGHPQLVGKGDKDPYAPAAGGGSAASAEIVHGTGGTRYRTAYFTFADDFVSNLHGSDMLVQLRLAASTQHDGRVLMWLNEHELAIYSRVLIELADTPPAALDTSEGKRALQQRLVAAINAVLEEREGFGGVSDVHFRSLIVQ